jgi:hypothetical protein
MPAKFPQRLRDAIDEASIIGVRAGSRPHRFIGMWAVVVNGRVFVRAWNGKPHGWYPVFLEERVGAIQVNGRNVRVRAAKRAGERLLDAIDAAYKAKYQRPWQRKFVTGFARSTRRARTLELLPLAPPL